jgi:hypothetical protein
MGKYGKNVASYVHAKLRNVTLGLRQAFGVTCSAQDEQRPRSNLLCVNILLWQSGNGEML